MFGGIFIFFKKDQSKLANYIELILVSVLVAVLIWIFDWPKYIYILLLFSILINVLAVEMIKREEVLFSMFKKTIVSLLSVCMILTALSIGGSIASADSGYSALPKLTPMQEYMYSTFAPASQTSYKKMTTVTKNVNKIIKEGKQLKVIGNNTALAAGGISGLITKTKLGHPIVLTGVNLVGSIGAGTFFLGNAVVGNYSKFKSGSKVVHAIYFKWKNPKTFEYSVKMESWVEYKGKKISKVNTSYFNGKK